MFFRLLFICYVVVLVVNAKNEDYQGCKIYNIKIEKQEQQDRFEELKSDLIDFLRKPSLKYGIVGRAMVPPSHFDWFEEKLIELDVGIDITVEDVYTHLENVERSFVRTLRNDEDRVFDFDGYYRYSEILDHLRALEEDYAETNVSINLEEYGVTDENRPLVYIKISQESVTDVEKPIVIIEAGINPREWITIPAALNIVNKVLVNTNETLDKSDWIVIPVLNPDGYEYTHTNLRLWAKNFSLRSNLGFICPGVNINRNFNMNWQLFDSSSSPCSHLYAGTEAFSEQETQFLRSLIEEYGRRTRLYISIQNNDGFVSYPWQHERAATGMFRQHFLLAAEMADAMDDDYRVDIGWLALGDRISGTSTDYVQDSGVLYSFNIDIVQRGVDGVNVPETEIVDVIEDVWRAVSVATDALL